MNNITNETVEQLTRLIDYVNTYGKVLYIYMAFEARVGGVVKSDFTLKSKVSVHNFKDSMHITSDFGSIIIPKKSKYSYFKQKNGVFMGDFEEVDYMFNFDDGIEFHTGGGSIQIMAI